MNLNILPPTTKKTAYHTCNKINNDIRNKTVGCINLYKDSGEAILTDKIGKLNQEWDTERFLEAHAACVMLISSILGYKRKKCCWFLLTGLAGFFLFWHALLGWCPLLPVIRMLGVRTAEEINNEKIVLKKIRGDFSQNTANADELLKNAEK